MYRFVGDAIVPDPDPVRRLEPAPGSRSRVRNSAILAIAAAWTASTPPQAAAEAARQIEEILVTAERRASTVSDTSISITAFTGEILEEFGIRNQEDLQNYIPAAVIEPYDVAIRGVGRNFRSLGGDPGVATYLNGVYSEDFGIASTEGGLYDIDRIEVLRGPQGTLYGRNAIGGAINFINRLPTDEFEGEARAIVGSYDLQEYYGMLSGPIIRDWLQARVTGVKRTRDGYIDDLGPAPDAGNYGDENYALGLRLTPTDTIEINTRVNERSYARRMAGADAGGIVVFGENNTDTRDTSTFVRGYRAVDPSITCPSQLVRTATVDSPGIKRGVGCTIAGMPTFTFRNPVTGADVLAQRKVPGVDRSDEGFNSVYGLDSAQLPVLGFDNINGDDLETSTNGHQDEYFDHQAVSLDAAWNPTDRVGFKYIFGYTDYFYDRTTDTDLSNNTLFDTQFYVSQEAEYTSHELQLFLDPTDALSITSGLFYYDAKLTQRGDNYDSTCDPGTACGSTYANDFPIPYGAIDPALAFIDFTPQLDLLSARVAGTAEKNGTPLPFYCGPLNGIPVYCFGKWVGDTGNSVPHGPQTVGSSQEYQTRTEREAYAAYTQATYTFSEAWALTLGVRWARDELDGYESIYYYTTDDVLPLGFDPSGGLSTLMFINQALGFLGPNGEILDPQRLLNAGLPTATSIWRELDRQDTEITWRANLDWTPTDDDLIYLSATKGYRGGGFNFGFFSSNPEYEPETLISYELGYKGTLLDGTLQINSALYYYDYNDIHTFGQGPSVIDPDETSTSVWAVPDAKIWGTDTEIVWLPTGRITLGLNFSYTHTEYASDFVLIDGFGEESPGSLFVAIGQPINIKGNRMPRIPEWKGGVWGQYEWPLGDLGQLVFFSGWNWIDKVYFSPFENEDDATGSYARLDARATWLSVDKAWNLTVFANNVFDEIGIRQIDRGGEGSNYLRSGATTDPRLIGLEVRYKFGGARSR